MLNRKEVLLRYMIAVVLFALALTGVVSGKMLSWCSILGTIELATAMTRYSPLMEVLHLIPVRVHSTERKKTAVSIRKA